MLEASHLEGESGGGGNDRREKLAKIYDRSGNEVLSLGSGHSFLCRVVDFVTVSLSRYDHISVM
jgi:hypothetical protein